MPIAHGEGCYYADGATLDELERDGQVLFRYATLDGGRPTRMTTAPTRMARSMRSRASSTAPATWPA